MELRLDNGWAHRGWLFDPRVQDLFWEFDVINRHMIPPVDVIEDKDAYHFYFEMPGLKRESLDARVEGGRLLVTAERKRPEWPQEIEVHITERGYGAIRRTFELPKDASHDKVGTGYKDGVLEVTVLKRSESKPAKILIN
jgi:HSP20 family protein